jgi:hypothetical protein
VTPTNDSMSGWGRVAALLLFTAVLASGFAMATCARLTVVYFYVEVGQDAEVEVEILESCSEYSYELRWGDGTVEPVSETGLSVLRHAYASAGDFEVELYWDFGLGPSLISSETIFVSEPEAGCYVDYVARFTVLTPVVEVGEEAEVEVEVCAGADTTFELRWGDGTITYDLPWGISVVTHTYLAAGLRLVQLYTPFEQVGLPDAILVVSPSGTTLSLSALTVEVGEVVVATVESAPAGAVLHWGDGVTSAVPEGDSEREHAYAAVGTFTVRLKDAGGSDLALEFVTVTPPVLPGTLVPTTVTLFEPLEWEAEGLTPGYAYELDFGDGTSGFATADSGGDARFPHTYTRDWTRFTATLYLVEGGVRYVVDAVIASASLPDPSETIEVEAEPDPDRQRFDLTVRLEGLLPGISYAVDFPGWTTATVTGDAFGEATVTASPLVGSEPLLAITLSAFLLEPGSLYVTVLRGQEIVLTEWPRGDERMTLETPDAPVLARDVVRVVMEDLVPGYGYELSVNGEVWVLPAADTSPWTVDVYMAAFTPQALFTLSVTSPFRETLAAEAVDVLVPVGALALPGLTVTPSGVVVVPFRALTPVEVTGLVPGVPYRVLLDDEPLREFVADEGGEERFEHPFERAGTLTLRVHKPGSEYDLIAPLASVAIGGVNYSGELRLAYELEHYLETGEFTLQVRRAATSWPHVLLLDFDGEFLEFETDEEGAADVVLSDVSFLARLAIVVGGETFGVVDLPLVALPPRFLDFYDRSWRVRVTSFDALGEDGPPPGGYGGFGVLEGFAVAGRLQESVPMRFDAIEAYAGSGVTGGSATSVSSFAAALPFGLTGLQVSIGSLKLGGNQPQISGTITTPTGESGAFTSFNHGGAGDGFLAWVPGKGSGRTLAPTPWTYATGASSGTSTLADLSTALNYTFTHPDGRNALVSAYAGWAEVGRASPAASGEWVGLLYIDAELRSGSGSGASLFKGDVAWTASGASLYLNAPLGTNGALSLGGWSFTDVTGLELLVVDDQVVRFTRPRGSVYLPFFGSSARVAFEPKAGGWSVSTLAPVAQDYGRTAVVGGIGTFVPAGNVLVLRFPSALWALDGDLSSDPTTVDGSAGQGLLESLADVGAVGEDELELYDDSVTTTETLLNLFKLQLLLKDLTLRPNGAVDLGGQAWRTLAKIPTLDMYGFPYLAAGAQIGVKRIENDRYAIGLKGELKLDDLIEAKAAPSWYEHQKGKEVRWVFEGVGAKFGDFKDSPVTFSLVLGGVIDFEKSALAFTGAGSITIPKIVSIEALALFGVSGINTSSPDVFWFVMAGVDLAAIEKPINVKVNGVDVMAFYAFRGGIASRMKLEVGGGKCRVDDGNIPQLILPSISKNAVDCYDPKMKVSFLAGTVIGSPAVGGSDSYGRVWHVDANLVVNIGQGSSVQLAGQGWIGKNLKDGYYKRGTEQPQLAARIVVNGDGITGSMCAGPVTSPGGILDCSGLKKAEIREGGLLLVELQGNVEFKASTATKEYYFALGTVVKPLSIYVIPRYTSGYFIVGFITKSGFLHPNVNLGANGVGGAWIGMSTGVKWDFKAGGKVVGCDWSVYAGANFGISGSLGMQLVPTYLFTASLGANASAAAGGSTCFGKINVSVSMSATGTFRTPNPSEFRGNFTVTAKLPVVGDWKKTFSNVGVKL